jgi:SAM-dependent methyltransferase
MKPADPIGQTALDILSTADRFNAWMYGRIAPYISGQVLEIGAGLGNITRHMLNKCHEVTTADVDPYYIGQLQHRFAQFPNHKETLLLDLQDAHTEEIRSPYGGRFDTVVLLNVIEHLPDETGALQRCRFLLRPGGRLIVLAPSYTWLFSRMDRELGHCRRYRSGQLRKTLSDNGFQIERSFYFNFLGIFGWLIGKWRNQQVLQQDQMRIFNKLVPVGKLLDRLVFRSAGLSSIVIAIKPKEND